MSRVALLRNPASTRNQKGAPAPDAPGGVHVVSVEAFDAMTDELVSAHDAGADTIVIDGGDGTVREVLSRVPRIWGDDLPRIAILPHGNTNLIAREVGGVVSARLPEFLTRIESGQALRECRRALLCVERAGQDPKLGFILGWGVYAEGTRIAHEEMAARGTGQVALAVLRMLRRGLIGAERARLRRGIAATIAIDGIPADTAPRLLGLATTLQDPLAAGFNPFWGEGSGRLRWLDVHAPGHRLALAAPLVAFGRPMAWMTRSGYSSGRAERISLELDTHFVMDGELFAPPPDGRLTLSAGAEMVFLSL